MYQQSKLLCIVMYTNAIVKDFPGSKHQLSSTPDEESCIFCCQTSGILHQCTTMGLDCDLQKMAKDIQDTTLIAKLSGGDLIAIEAKYQSTQKLHKITRILQ